MVQITHNLNGTGMCHMWSEPHMHEILDITRMYTYMQY